MHREREKDNFKSREVKRLKECALALSKSQNQNSMYPNIYLSECKKESSAEIDLDLYHFEIE